MGMLASLRAATLGEMKTLSGIPEATGRIQVLPSALYFFLIGSLALVMMFSIDERVVPAFATAPPSPPLETANNAVDATGSPRVFYRGISETLSVASTFGNPGAPNHYTRTMSESISITSTLPGQPHQISSSANPALRTAQNLPAASQRGDERASLRFENLKKGSLADRGVIGGTQYLNLEALMNLPMSTASFDRDAEGSSDTSEPNDNNIFLRQLAAYAPIDKSAHNAELINASISAALLAGAIGSAITRQYCVSGGRLRRSAIAVLLTKKFIAIGAVRQVTGNGSVTYVLILAAAAFVVSPMSFAMVPSSGQEYPDNTSKSMIEISSAYHLDPDRQILGDIFEEARELDDVWSEEIPDGHYVRVTFEQELTSANDITVYPRIVSGNPRIEIYEKSGAELIAKFGSLTDSAYNKVFLAGLEGSQDTFDLRILDGSIEFDHIIDPVTGNGIAILKGTQLSGGGTDLIVSTKTALSWNTSQDYDTNYFAYSGSSNTRLTVTQSGDYLVSVTVPITSDADKNGRNGIEAEIRVNGVKQDVGVGRSTYIRNTNNHFESSAHLAVLLKGLSANDYIEVFVARTTNEDKNFLSSDTHLLYAEYVSDKIVFAATATKTTSGTNLNDAKAPLEWTEYRKDQGYTHSDSTSSQNITLDEAGNYLVLVNVPLGGSSSRTNILGSLRLDGVDISGGQFKQGYIRNADSHKQSSIHWGGIVTTTGVNQVLDITVEQEAASGTVTVDGEKATVYIQKLSSAGLYFGQATQVGGADDWNPSSRSAINWATDKIIDTSVYSHSTSSNNHQITILADGDYMLVFNAAFSASTNRVAPITTVQVNGADVAGLEGKSGYIRNTGRHNEASNIIVSLLPGLSANDVITVSMERGGNSGTAIDDTPAHLVLLRKPVMVDRGMSDNLAISDTLLPRTHRPVSDTITTDDSISVRVSRLLSDGLSVTDVISTDVTRPVVDSVAIVDSISTSFAPAVSDSVALKDLISMHVTRALGDNLSIDDSISTLVTRSIDDDLLLDDSLALLSSRSADEDILISESISTVVTRSIAEGLSLDDSITLAVMRSTDDSLVLVDSISVAVARHVNDELGLVDTTAGKVTGRVIMDSVSITDTVAPAVSRPFQDTLILGDSISISASRQISDELEITDGIERTLGRTVSDGLSISEQVSIARVAPTTTADSLAISDAISMQVAFTLTETVSITDTAGQRFERSMADSMSITDEIFAVSGVAVAIQDSVGITSQLTDVSVHWNRFFEESVALGDCTPFACNQVLQFNESISISDVKSKSLPRQVSNTLTTSDKIDYLAKFMPPAGVILGPMVTTNPATIAPPASTPVTGNFSMSQGVQQLADDLGLPSLDPTALLTGQTTLILPTYKVPLTWTEQLPTENTFMTVKVTKVPANTPVMVPVNMAATPNVPQGSQVPWMKMEFMPQVDSSDFALVVTPLDSQPQGAPPPQASLTPLYIDVRWVGTFPLDADGNPVTPDKGVYYADPPKFTFALTDEWANNNNAERDANGVPMITLNLLNESTNQWETISNIDMPTGLTDGQYVYVAHLEHFSTYVVTANKAASSGGRGGITPLEPNNFAVNLLDSLLVQDAQDTLSVEVIEEFAGRTFNVVIADRLGISVKPVAYQTFKVGENVNVSIGIEDITYEGIILQTAKAAFSVQVANRGTNHETFQLNFWYADPTGRRAYESSQQIEVGPFETREYRVQVPVSSPGTFVVTVEARSVPQGTLLNAAQFTVNISWLSIYLHLLLGVAAAILGGSLVAGILLLRMTRGKMDRFKSQP